MDLPQSSERFSQRLKCFAFSHSGAKQIEGRDEPAREETYLSGIGTRQSICDGIAKASTEKANETMTPKEKRDRKNANHRRNEEKRFQRRVNELVSQFHGLQLSKTSGSQDR